MKKLLKILLVIVVLLIVAILALPLWISPLVTGVVQTAAPTMLGVDVKLGKVTVNPYTGNFGITELHVKNPVDKGYTDNDSFSVSDVAIQVDPASLIGDVIHIKKIDVAAPLVRVEMKGLTSNISAMLDNLPKSEPSEKPKSTEEKKEKNSSSSPEKKIIVDQFILHDGKVAFDPIGGAAVKLPMPQVELKDLGKENGGATTEEVIQLVVTKVLETANEVASKRGVSKEAIGDAVKSLLKGKK
ncbi:MAG: hypothetical protein IJR99_01710 [Kiritimatiellae bacterium]|nr:hypothetical protein [Kiritimatiellia bacterium]